jgi:lysophospholipase L1-like esterase
MLFSRATSGKATGTRALHRGLLGRFWRRTGAAVSLAMVAVVVTGFMPGQIQAATTLVGVKSYYLGLGDSLAFGYQPNVDWSHGYVQQWYANLQGRGSKSLTNYGCAGETSSTFINGGCPYWYLLHNYYLGPQLSAAVDFLKEDHAGAVSPVSLDIGANDMLPDINTSNCTVSSSWSSDLARLDSNLTGTILPRLTKALTNAQGQRTGDLVMMNYYDPFQNICANSLNYVEQLDQHLASDAARFGVPIADVFTAFGGPGVPNSHICTDTWMCSSYKDIHATSTGYGVIAGAFENRTGY